MTSLAYIYTMEQKDSCQRMVYGEYLLCTIFVIVQFCFLFQDMIAAVYRGHKTRSGTRICQMMSTEKDLNFTTVFRHKHFLNK